MADTAKNISTGVFESGYDYGYYYYYYYDYDYDYTGKLGAGLVDAEAFVECASYGAPSKSPTVSPAPTTAAPSLQPTISPAPTPDCGCLHDVLVRVQTDGFPSETSWTFESLDAPYWCEALQTKSGPFENSSTTYSAYATQRACEGVY